jgi:hypothetical protein
MKINPIRQKIYKVVFAEGGRLYSWQCSALSEYGLGITYAPNKIVRARVGRLFAFDNEYSAQQYDRYVYSGNRQVWEGWGYGVSPLFSRLQLNGFDMINEFWESNAFSETRLEYSSSETDCVPNTVGCKSIKLTKRIE